MISESAQHCWIKPRVLRVVIVQLPGAAGVRNLIRSSRHSSVTTTEEERFEDQKEGFGGEKIKRNEGFLP